MTKLHFETDVRAPLEQVFTLITDLRAYDTWLPGSTAFHGTTTISDGPIRVGTTYVEPGPFAVRHGRVIELVPHARVAFEQPMTLRPRFCGVVGIHVACDLIQSADVVRVRRSLDLTFHGPVKLARAVIIRLFKDENERTLDALKTFAERQAQSR
ncbi:MAG: SRPBCC family protein [Rhodanobacter sp.]